MTQGGNIYFVAPVGGGLIKIGFACNPEKRLRSLQVGCPIELELLASVHGTTNDERKLHRIFLAAHSHGEWFKPTPHLVALVMNASASKELPSEMRASGFEPSVLWKGGNATVRPPAQRAHMRHLEKARNSRNAEGHK